MHPTRLERVTYILVGAKKKTAFLNALFLCRPGGIEWHFRALRVSREHAGHVVEAVAIGGRNDFRSRTRDAAIRPEKRALHSE